MQVENLFMKYAHSATFTRKDFRFALIFFLSSVKADFCSHVEESCRNNIYTVYTPLMHLIHVYISNILKFAVNISHF